MLNHVDLDLYRCRLRHALLNEGVKLGDGYGKDGKLLGWIIDCREVLLHNDYLKLAGRLLWELLKPYAPQIIGGSTMSAEPLIIAVLY